MPNDGRDKIGCTDQILRVDVRYMIADASKPNKLRNVRIHHTKHGEERHHPKTEHLLYHTQSHRVESSSLLCHVPMLCRAPMRTFY